MKPKTLSTQINKPKAARTFKSPQLDQVMVAMRHGKVEYTPEEIQTADLQGTLTEAGANRVELAATEIINELQSLQIKQVQIFRSPKQRCIETAELLSRRLDQAEITHSVTEHALLRDVEVVPASHGIPSSYQRWEADMLPSETWFDAWKRKAAEGMQFYPGEESPADVTARVEQALDELVSSLTNLPQIVVTHEEVLGAIGDTLGITWTNPTYAEVWYLQPTADQID